MQAIVLRELGGPENLHFTDSFPIPTPGAGEVLIKNELAGVNFADVYFREGHYPSPGGWPLVLGLEAIGTVAQLPEPNASGLRVGDRVLFSNVLGAYAEYTAVPAEKVVKAVPQISNKDAVGGYTVGLTALSLVEQAATLCPGQTALVHAAAGGVGLVLCQLLKDRGVTVIGTAGSKDKFAIALANGASHMINYKAISGSNWVERVKEITEGQGVDVVSTSSKYFHGTCH